MLCNSRQALQHSLPNRLPSQRPRSLSLSEYQPVPFDREATALAYRAQLHQPVSASNSSYSLSSSGSHDAVPPARPQSSLTKHLRRGDNPHLPAPSSPIDLPPPAPLTDGDNFTGVGYGHSLTPPRSPIHQAAAEAHRTSLNLSAGVSGSSLEHGYIPPLPPPELTIRPPVISDSVYPPGNARGRQRSGSGSAIQRTRPPSWLAQTRVIEESTSELEGSGMAAVDSRYADAEADADGWESDPGYPRYVGGRSGARRQLPAVPTNVPTPVPPEWEPDYKPQIPEQLVESSIQHAHAQLSPTPPGLPPRPRATAYGTQHPYAAIPSSYGGASSSGQYTDTTPLSAPSMASPAMHSPGLSSPAFNPPAGAPSFPFQVQPIPPRPRRQAEETVILRAAGRTPIWSTHFLDPSLRNPLINIPQQVSNITAKAYVGLTKDVATAAQMEGMARMAKGWFVPPDGKFSTDKGAIDLSLAIIDSGGRDGEQDWGREKGRRKAKVEISSRTGGIKLDLVDFKIDTKSGDIVILLPLNFLGSINITTPGPDPHFCNAIKSAISPVSHPYETVYVTTITPPVSDATLDGSTVAHQSVVNGTGKKRWIPEFLRPQDEVSLHPGQGAAEWSKITVATQGTKGSVVLAYRETEDEDEVKGMKVMVGMEGQEKKKRWWR